VQLDDQEQEGGTDAEASKADDRLERLARFQLECLKHALSFPQVQLVSYSTCSVHQIENEEVVAKGKAVTINCREAGEEM